MKLADYMQAKGLTLGDAATDIGVTAESMCRYAGGQRIPRPQIMRRIVKWSEGKVTANDFYDLPDCQERRSA